MMEYTGAKLIWNYAYGNCSTSIYGIWIYVNYSTTGYQITVAGRKLKSHPTELEVAKHIAIGYAVDLFTKALTKLE